MGRMYLFKTYVTTHVVGLRVRVRERRVIRYVKFSLRTYSETRQSHTTVLSVVRTMVVGLRLLCMLWGFVSGTVVFGERLRLPRHNCCKQRASPESVQRCRCKSKQTLAERAKACPALELEPRRRRGVPGPSPASAAEASPLGKAGA